MCGPSSPRLIAQDPSSPSRSSVDPLLVHQVGHGLAGMARGAQLFLPSLQLQLFVAAAPAAATAAAAAAATAAAAAAAWRPLHTTEHQDQSFHLRQTFHLFIAMVFKIPFCRGGRGDNVSAEGALRLQRTLSG